MQSIQHVHLISSGYAERDVQERVQQAERAALIRSAKVGRPGIVASIRLRVGRLMVSSGRRIARQPRKQERWIDVPSVVRPARW